MGLILEALEESGRTETARRVDYCLEREDGKYIDVYGWKPAVIAAQRTLLPHLEGLANFVGIEGTDKAVSEDYPCQDIGGRLMISAVVDRENQRSIEAIKRAFAENPIDGYILTFAAISPYMPPDMRTYSYNHGG